jgi:hypothetical protein
VTLREQYEADRDLLLSTELPWVQSVTYTGDTVSASFQIKSEEMADGRRESAELIVSNEDVAAPAYRDAVIVDGVTWRVMRILSSDRSSHRLELFRDENPVWAR